MLLYIYLGTTAFVWTDAILHQLYLDRRLKSEGYKFTNKKSPDDIVWGAFYFMILCIPVLHLISPLSHIDKDRSYDEYMNYLEEAGAIEKVEDFVNKKEINVITINNDKLVERTNSSGHIYYSPMNRYEENNIIEENGKVYKKVIK